MPRVLKRKNFRERLPPNSVLVARPSKWQSPFKLGEDGTREEVIAKYRTHIENELAAGRLDITELTGKDLVCYCAPLPCHGEVLLELANKKRTRR